MAAGCPAYYAFRFACRVDVHCHKTLKLRFRFGVRKKIETAAVFRAFFLNQKIISAFVFKWMV
jgi:hypothetical protein